MSTGPRELHLHIGRIVVDAAPGADRRAVQRALAAQLAAQLPAAIVDRKSVV